MYALPRLNGHMARFRKSDWQHMIDSTLFQPETADTTVGDAHTLHITDITFETPQPPSSTKTLPLKRE